MTWRDAVSGTLTRARSHWAERQYRNAYYLMLNSVAGGAAGLLFWLVLVRLYAVPDAEVGLGLAVLSVGTAMALVAKGGLDTALVRHVPRRSRAGGLQLLGLAAAVGLAAALALTALVGLAPGALGALGVAVPALDAAGLAVAGALAALLVVTWLQDAHFLAEGEARFSFYRNLVMHGARLLAPAAVLALALPHAIPLAWTLALALSALAALAFVPRLPDLRPAPPRSAGTLPRWPDPPGSAGTLPRWPDPAIGARRTPRPTAAEPPGDGPGPFLRTAARNLTGTTAEFLPGLALAPLVLHAAGAEQAAYFGIAWTGASMLFLLAASIARSTFAEMSRAGRHGRHLRRGLRQQARVVGPLALGAVLASPVLLGLFGPAYAREGLPVFLVLAASVALVAPVYLHLALLRARDDRVQLVVLPALLLAGLALAVDPAVRAHGILGVGLAWVGVHAPLAAWAAWSLRRALRAPDPEEVTLAQHEPEAVRGASHLE